MKRMMAQRNSFRMSANYDAIGFSQEQLLMMQEKDQALDDMQFSFDECSAQLEEVGGVGREKGREGGRDGGKREG